MTAQAARLLGRDMEGTAELADQSAVSPWALQAVQGVVSSGWMDAGDGAFRPRDGMTRAEGEALAARLEGGAALVGWDGARAVPLEEADILRCYGEEKGVRVQTPGGVYDLKERLYELEGRLDRHAFVRISHSEIVNLRKITALDLSLTGTIRVTLEGGAVSYVSRRYVRKIKEALGL